MPTEEAAEAEQLLSLQDFNQHGQIWLQDKIFKVVVPIQEQD